VGEHKARKEKEEMFKRDDKSPPRRRSTSTASSRWSTDSPFAIFRTRGSRKANVSSVDAEMASGSSGVGSPAIASSDLSPMSKTFDERGRRSSSRMSTSFLERLANFESPLNTSPLLSEKSGDACRKLFCNSAIEGNHRLACAEAQLVTDSSTDITSSLSAIKRFSIAGSTSDNLTESEKMQSLVQIFRRSQSTVEPAGNCSLPSAGHAAAPDHFAHGDK
jgi:hypothetical protein